MDEMEKKLRGMKPYVLGWVASYLENYLAGGLGVRSVSLGAESGADYGDLRISGAIKRSTAMAARVHRISNASLTHNQWTCLSFEAAPRFEQPATVDFWSAASPSRLYAPVTGIYFVHVQVKFAPNVTGQRAVMLRRNAAGLADGGTEIAATGAQAVNSATWNTDLHLSTLAALNAGDYLEAFALQNSGAALDLLHADESAPEFMLCRIA